MRIVGSMGNWIIKFLMLDYRSPGSTYREYPILFNIMINDFQHHDFQGLMAVLKSLCA